jgi:hypothetical protein
MSTVSRRALLCAIIGTGATAAAVRGRAAASVPQPVTEKEILDASIKEMQFYFRGETYERGRERALSALSRPGMWDRVKARMEAHKQEREVIAGSRAARHALPRAAATFRGSS